MKLFKRILIGCLGLAVLLVVIVVGVVATMLALGPPDTRREQTEHEQPVVSERLPAPIEPAPGEVPLPPPDPITPESVVQIILELEEGEFDVMRGNPGEGIRIEGDYDSGLFQLDQERLEGDAGVEKIRIRFYPKYSALRRLLTLGDIGGPENNHITIYLPPDAALDLHAEISKAESRLDLTGLALTGLNLDLTMGEHHVDIRRPNPLEIDILKLRASMGEIHAEGLGNARFREARIDGSMGELTVDLLGSYRADAFARVHHSMGELRIVVPRDIHVEVTKNVMLGGVSTSGFRREREIPESAPTLTVEGSVTMGELQLIKD